MKKAWKLAKAVAFATALLIAVILFVLMVAWTKGLAMLLILFAILVAAVYERM